MFGSEKGSIPVVMIIALTSILTVLILGNMLVAETVAAKKQNQKLIQESYSTRNTLEATTNIILQKISGSRTDYQQKTFYPLYSNDMQEAASTLNSSILPHIAPNNTITISNLEYDKSLDMLCDETTAVSSNTNSKVATGVTCKSIYFYMSYDLKIVSPKNTRNVHVKIDKLYPQEASESGYIKVNYDNVQVDYSSL